MGHISGTNESLSRFSIDYLEDEIELKTTIIHINMHPKAIDFNMQDIEFDYDIDID